ncbi:MAG: AEC family transporter [Desulfobacterales bacterium]|nr:AEC family transporter [Desulfobacterales bacterium]
MMILSSIFPVFALIIAGRILKKTEFINDNFLSVSDKLLYFIFFPTMLFWKIGGSGNGSEFNINIVWATLSTILFIFAVSTIFIIWFKVKNFDAGSFSQSCYRFNTYIGFAVIINALGEEGIRFFGIIISFAIPIINILSISLLSWFDGSSGSTLKIKKRVLKMAGSILKNPLIIACVSGLLFSNLNLQFPKPLDNLFELVSTASLPLALISIGGSFTSGKLKDYLNLSIIGSVFKLIFFPLSGLVFLHFFGVTGVAFKTCLIFFALPTATSIYVLSSQMNSNTDLAASTIVLSTAFSFISLSAVMLYIS